jgi:aspartate aminotransferase
MDLEFVAPDGAMYLFAKINKPGFDGVEFANKLLDYGVAVAPGDGFGNYKSFVRISACQDEKKLIVGMKILDEVLRGSR